MLFTICFILKFLLIFTNCTFSVIVALTYLHTLYLRLFFIYLFASIFFIVALFLSDVGWVTQMSNGAVCIQFDDGYQLTVYAHKSEVVFIHRNGSASR